MATHNILIGECENKRGGKHTARLLPAQLHTPQTRLHVASGLLIHHRYAAKLPLRRRLCSGEEHRPYNARCLQIHRDGRGPHRAYNEVVLRVVEKWVP